MTLFEHAHAALEAGLDRRLAERRAIRPTLSRIAKRAQRAKRAKAYRDDPFIRARGGGL